MSKFVDKNIDDGLILSGYQKKFNTMKKKFFVLYKETAQDCARLEYFDSIKKFKSGTAPKRVVKLENCFNINRRLDTKYDFVIALATKDGGFGIVLDSETEMLKWLQALLSLQRSTTNQYETSSKFDHVWQVVVQKKSLAEERKIIGNYHVCLSPKAVTFIRIGPEKSSSGYIRTTDIQIPLNTIRRCGDSHCLFYMEVGRQCTIGPGELWMETEDPLVAQSMHSMISRAMSARTDANGDMMRRRSSSVTEKSKPINFIDPGNIHPEIKNCNINQSENNNLGRGRCDSFPSKSRESHVLSISHTSTSHRPIGLPRHSTSPPTVTPFSRPAKSEPIKLEDEEETGNYLPFRFKSAERVIPEENSEDLINSDGIGNPKDTYISMAPVVKLMDSTENNKTKQKNPIDLGDAAILPSGNFKNCMLAQNLSTQMHSINIYSTVSTDLEKEERPKRSYSIGSKIDKNKIKRFGNSNEILHDTNAVRVRAFSVGSRAKIPKCDLQRAVMFPRSRLNQSCISNNSLNFGTDEAGHKSDLNSSCGKKSTSAPILVQNCPVPMDYMSDLMEIDFSKSASHKGHGKGALERVDSCLHELKGHLTSKYESDFSGPLSLKSKDCRESGYLEMKPIDCVIDKKTAASYSECLVKMPKLNDNSTVTFVKRTEIKNTAQGKNVPARKSLNTLNEVSFNQIKGRLKESDYSTCGNIDYLSSIYSNLWIQPSSNNHSEEEKGFAELDVKLPKKEYNTKIISENLQNNSEYLKENGSSEQRSTGIMEKYLNFASSSSMSSGQLSSRCKSSSVNPFNDGQTAITVEGNRENENLLRNFPIDYKPQITNVSISALDCYNYELYYAKLDLPQSCSKEDVKFHKTENDLSPIVNTDNDSYAKINFEHSSDSSSSSKTINN